MFTPTENPLKKSCKHCMLRQLNKKKFYVSNRLFKCILLLHSPSATPGLNSDNGKQQGRRKPCFISHVLPQTLNKERGEKGNEPRAQSSWRVSRGSEDQAPDRCFPGSKAVVPPTVAFTPEQKKPTKTPNFSSTNPSPCHLTQCQTSANAAMLMKEALPLLRRGGGTSENNFASLESSTKCISKRI